MQNRSGPANLSLSVVWAAAFARAAASLCILAALIVLTGAVDALAQGSRDARAFAATLGDKDRKEFEDWFTARTFYNAELDAYWGKVEAKRASRRKKKAQEEALVEADYVDSFPPEYKGPALGKRLADAWAKFQEDEEPRDKPPPDEIPGLDVYLLEAKRQYGFEPERIAEREFKRRYAAEALRLGLTREQVVRVYALETGGLGTADMQAGIHPIRKTGKPISSALGYAQLLNANSIGELVKHGGDIVERLKAIARQPGLSSERQERIAEKVTALGKMLARVRKVPNQWASHVAFARTPAGQGVHAINIDGDIGPWLQVIKLKGIKDIATRAGRGDINPTELELMNLAGPGTGLEMMTSVGRGMPTPNFFERRGYYRNSVVRGRTSAQLLDALEERMNQNEKNSGAVEFYAVFDEVIAAQGSRQARQ